MNENEFRKLVEKTLQEMPEKTLKQMENVVIVIEQRPASGQLRKSGIRAGNLLLGLYQGVPKTKWGRGFGNILPDKITIFQESVERLAKSEDEISEILRNTIFHEILHHFGFDEKSLRELERKRKLKKN